MKSLNEQKIAFFPKSCRRQRRLRRYYCAAKYLFHSIFRNRTEKLRYNYLLPIDSDREQSGWPVIILEFEGFHRIRE